MNAISNDDIRIVTLFKSARIGFTKIVAASVGYFAEHKNRNQIIWQPTDTDARDFVSDEIDPMIRDVPVLRKILRGDADKKGKDNTKHRKAFLGSVLDIKGGKSARNFRRTTKDVAYYDELDGFDSDIEGEGSPTSLGDVRITNSSFPKSVRGSTPGIKGASQIESSLNDADMVFRRYLPCPECDEFQYLKWSNFNWANSDPKTTKYACEHCGSLLDYSQFPEMDAQGEWRTEDGIVLDGDDNFTKDGELLDPPFHAGFIIWAAYSYFTAWSELVAEFLKANAAKKVGDNTKLKSFVNTRLGELWEDENESVEGEGLLERRENYGPEIPENVLLLTAGIDIQDDRIECEIVGWGHGSESWSIEYNVIIGDTSQDPSVKDSVWHRLDDYLLTKFTHETGVTMKVAAACIDSGGHRTPLVYKFCAARIRRRIFAIKGMDGEGKPLAGGLSKSKKYKATFIPVGVDTAKELIYSRLKVQEHGAGYSHFPAHYDQHYFDMLTAEKCIPKFVRGKASRLWVLKSGGRRNEALDCRVYAMAALELLNPNLNMIEKRMLPKEEPQPEQPEPSAKLRKRVRKQRGGFVNRW